MGSQTDMVFEGAVGKDSKFELRRQGWRRKAGVGAAHDSKG